MRIIYRADDGTEFDDELECGDYEWMLNHENFKSIEFFDEDGKQITCGLFTEEVYGMITRINVYNEESIEELREFAKYIGFYSYYDVNEPGVWVWGDKDSVNQGFIKVSNVQYKKPVGAEYLGYA